MSRMNSYAQLLVSLRFPTHMILCPDTLLLCDGLLRNWWFVSCSSNKLGQRQKPK